MKCEMKFIKLTTVMLAAMAMVACDDTTDTIGSSTTNNIDRLSVSDSIYNVTTQSLQAGAVLSRTNIGIIGKVRDPETGTYVTANYMTQFAVLPTFSIEDLDSIKMANDGKLEADSCYLLVSYQSSYGDSLAPMKVTAYEMSKAMPETQDYYSDFDPEANGYVSQDNFHASSSYTLTGSDEAFRIYLNKPYTDKDGNTYKNYGSYIMQTYEKHPEYFKSNYELLTNVCPGFYLKYTGGLGNVAEVWNTELQVHWKWKRELKTADGLRDSVAYSHTWTRFDGTEEVLQTNYIQNDANQLAQLVNDNSCTYVKSPAGIFTEATLPVEDIIKGHEKDTLNTASISFPRINNEDESNKYAFSTPTYLLMIPKDSINSFFESGSNINNRTSYYATYNAVNKNAYTFGNVSNLVTLMANIPASERTENWNKVVLIPISITTATEGTSTVISKITHNMGLTSTKLMKGVDTYETDDKGNKTPTGPVQAKVIYSKFKEK